jgi:hypothetical protein
MHSQSGEITMVRTILALSLLALSLAAPGAEAQTAPPAAATPAANAVDPASIQALKDMGAFLQSLKRFRVSTELTGERVLAISYAAAPGISRRGHSTSSPIPY